MTAGFIAGGHSLSPLFRRRHGEPAGRRAISTRLMKL